MEQIFNSQEALDEARKWAVRHGYKPLSTNPLKDKCILEFIDEENTVKYIWFNEIGESSRVIYSTFKECALSALLNLGINDSKILNMLMSL